MEIRRLPADEDAVRRYVERLWLPYHRDLEAAVADHALADPEGTDLVAEETEFRLDSLEGDTYRAWVAVETDGGNDRLGEGGYDRSGEAEEEVAGPTGAGTGDGDDGVATAGDDGEWVGFVTTDVDRCPTVFDRPDRLVVGDLYVAEPYRGTGLARALMGRAADRAQELDCPELALDVDVDNDRAVGFYGKLGFEVRRRRMTVPADRIREGRDP